MSELDERIELLDGERWSSLDYERLAHWWVGASGTACGKDFRQDVRQADASAPRCWACVTALSDQILGGQR